MTEPLSCSGSCCTMCSMEVSRKTVNFDPRDAAVVSPFLEEGTEEHAALERLSGTTLRSDSAELRALVLLGAQRVRDALLADQYDAAVEAGDFDDTVAWVEATGAARRRGGT